MNISCAALCGGSVTVVADAGAKRARSNQSQHEVAQLLFFIFSIFMALLDCKCCFGLGALPLQF